MKKERRPLFLRKLFTILFVSIMFVGLSLTFAPTAHAANPTLTPIAQLAFNAPSGTSMTTTSATASLESLASVTIVAYVVTNSSYAVSLTDSYALTWTQLFQVSIAPPRAGSLPVFTGSLTVFAANAATTPGTTDLFTATLKSAVTSCANVCGILELQYFNTYMVYSPQFTPVPPSSNLQIGGGTYIDAFAVGGLAAQGNAWMLEDSFAAFSNSGGHATITYTSSFTTLGCAMLTSCSGTVGVTGSITQGAGSNELANVVSGVFVASPSTATNYGATYTYTPTFNGNWYSYHFVMIFVPGISSPGGTSQTQTIGSCPPGGGTGVGHYALANNTIYFYNGNALGSEVVNTVSTEVLSIKGSGTHYLELLIYASTSTPPSIAYPNTRLYESKVFAITSGTTNSTITLQVAVPLNGAVSTPLPFNWWSVGIVGDDHINIAGSTTSGLVTQTGTTPTGSSNPPIQPSSFTTSGTSSTNKLALCATGSYQSISAGLVVTSTTTQSASSTVLVTSTSTVTTIGANLFNSSSNWPVIFLILLLPAGLFLGVTKSLAGGILGLMIGAVIGIMMGLLPLYIFMGLVIALVALAFVVRERA